MHSFCNSKKKRRHILIQQKNDNYYHVIIGLKSPINQSFVLKLAGQRRWLTRNFLFQGLPTRKRERRRRSERARRECQSTRLRTCVRHAWCRPRCSCAPSRVPATDVHLATRSIIFMSIKEQCAHMLQLSGINSWPSSLSLVSTWMGDCSSIAWVLMLTLNVG